MSNGLTKTQRTILGIVIYSLLGIQPYLILEVANGTIPAFILIPFNIGVIIASVAERQLGLKPENVPALSGTTPQ